jgi:hypothetical protein
MLAVLIGEYGEPFLKGTRFLSMQQNGKRNLSRMMDFLLPLTYDDSFSQS